MPMNGPFVFLLMLFCHVIADYNLQGWLASAKQKEWWQKNAPEKMYKFDYICALLVHSFSWAFMIMLPIAFLQDFNINDRFVTMIAWNTLMHAWMDNHKANNRTVNLWIDQAWHIIQIIVTMLTMLYL